MRRMTIILCALAAILLSVWMPGAAVALEKEVSLVTGEAIGDLAVAGRLSVDLHAEFMVSQSYDTGAVLNWYNCGYSGGNKVNQIGGNFGDFGFQVPFKDREKKYPHAATVFLVRAVKFDGGNFLKGNFRVEEKLAGKQKMALELWLRSAKPAKNEVILGWQAVDGKGASAPIHFPAAFKGADCWQHIVVNCTPEKETWYVNGQKVFSGPRETIIAAGHVMVLGGESESKPSFKGELAAVRLHDNAMTEEEIDHNFKGGVLLGTEMHSWWRNEPDKWYVVESAHFKHAVDKEEMKKWTDRQLKEFNERVPGMFNLSELIYRTYSERLAIRSAVVSRRAEKRGDGIKYKIPIQPSQGSWMGVDDDFGWACQGEGFINPHELVHGWDAQTGGMQGNFWEAHANFPQTYNGVYQTIPVVVAEASAFPANGRDYYHDRLFFEHIAQTPEYGPMFIAKMWYDGPTKEDSSPYPAIAFSRINPYPDHTLADMYTSMAMHNVTYDYQTWEDARGGKGNTGYGNDAVPRATNLYRETAERDSANINRWQRVVLQKIPYQPEWYRVPKEQAPQQLGWNICPLKFKPGKVSATLEGYVDALRGSDWRAGFVGVDKDGNPVYGKISGAKKTMSFDAKANIQKLYLVVCAVPTKILPIDMVGDFRSFEQEQFPYKVKLSGCEPMEVMVNAKPDTNGGPHANGGGFVASRAQVDASAYVGPNAMVLGNSKVLGNAKILDEAVVRDATVKDNAVVCGHALVTENSTVAENAKVRDYAVVRGQTTVQGYARILEHAAIFTNKKTCSDEVTVKGVASVYGGNQSGTALIDGFYAKGNEITKGKWFTWSWGQGKNPGEIEEDFGGMYADYCFEEDHGPLAMDQFGASWGYIVNSPKLLVDSARVGKIKAPERSKTDEKSPVVRVPGQVLVLDGKTQFVELPKDVADFSKCTYTAEVKWDGNPDSVIFEFGTPEGNAVWLSPSEGGKLVFGIKSGKVTETVSGTALVPRVWAKVQIVVDGSKVSLIVNDKQVAQKDNMTLAPDSVGATQCYLGRGITGKFFGGSIGRFTVYSVPVAEMILDK